MAQVAVCKDGREVIGDSFVRGYFSTKHSLILEGDYFNMDASKYTHWVTPYYNPDEGTEDVSVSLPKGTIKKLIGRELTWEDEPVNLEDEL